MKIKLEDRSSATILGKGRLEVETRVHIPFWMRFKFLFKGSKIKLVSIINTNDNEHGTIVIDLNIANEYRI